MVDPTPKEIIRRAEQERRKRNNRKCAGLTGHRILPTAWSEGDAAWAVDCDGDAYFGTIVEGPYDCSDGKQRVIIQAEDGDWEFETNQLRLDRPASPIVSTTKERPMPRVAKAVGTKTSKAKKAKKAKTRKAAQPKTRKAGGATNGEEILLCHCGCGGQVRPKKLFLQGHDARFHGRVKKIKDGRLKLSDLEGLGVQPYALPFYKAG